MEKEKFYDDRINYSESCFVVNAMNYYIKNFKEKTLLSEESLKYYDEIIDKYCKLENQILELRIKE